MAVTEQNLGRRDPFGQERPIGFGRLKRKEDARFIRGKGNYLDDIRLPGMLHGVMLRSPYAHAKIVSIDTSKALEHPGVAAVITAKDLETLGLAWMPTISYDTQAVLAGDKVRFQGQEVAFVIATCEYIACDALALIEVEYEPLPAIVNARKALDPDAPLIRDDKEGQTDNLASPLWGAGDEAATNRAFAEADVVVKRGVDLIRRGGQLPERIVHGLPDPDGARVPRLRARRDSHSVSASSARCEGRRRIAERRVAARNRQRGDRRAASDSRGHAHRHAVLARARVGRDAGTPRAAAVISGALSRKAKELAEQGQAFVVATVVRVEHPTSVKPGSAALVSDDGAIDGFVGGVCAQHSARLYSLRAIETGEPLLLPILPDAATGSDSEDGRAGEDPSRTMEVSDEEGTVTVSNPCLSGGTIEVFLEPVLPAPRVLLAGDSPIVAALRRIGPELGLSLVITSDGGVVPAHGDLGLVVAAHGRDELGILRAGLEAGLPYVGLVASRKRGGAVVDQLRDAGVCDQLLARLETPAGLDIGARSAAEIALSILARIVEVRRLSSHARTTQNLGARPITAVDPVCGMTIVIADDTPALERNSRTVYFCCMGCKLTFEEQHGDRAVAG